MNLLAILRPAVPRLAVPPFRTLALVAGLTLVYAALAAIMAPADDEFYYWCWAQNLQWSYYDHPAMTAVMIRAAEVFGHNIVALRLPACFASAVCFTIILHLTKPKTVAWWLLATPAFSVGACIVTPDTPLILFWAAYVLWLVKMHEAPSLSLRANKLWILGGVLLGLGVLGKYTMALAIPAGCLSFLLAAPIRIWLAGYILHGVIAFLTALPILIFNIQNDFAPLRYQWTHTMGTPNASFANFGSFVGIQIVLFGTMPLVLFPWVLRNWRSLSESPRLRVCLCLFGFPFAFFLYKATRGHLEGNWALASYIAFWPLAAEWYQRHRGTRFGEWGMRASFLVPGLASAFLFVHTLIPFSILGTRHDRITRQAEKDRIAAAIAADWKSGPRLPMFTDTYQWVALLRWHGVDARQAAGVSRPSHFTHPEEHPSDLPECYLLWNEVIRGSVRDGLKEPVEVKRYPLDIHGQRLAEYVLWKVEREK